MYNQVQYMVPSTNPSMISHLSHRQKNRHDAPTSDLPFPRVRLRRGADNATDRAAAKDPLTDMGGTVAGEMGVEMAERCLTRVETT